MTLHIADGLDMPDQAVTETFAILAKRRTGKSNAAVVMAEEMYDAGHPWVAVDPKGDWWGMRASGDGKAPGLAVLVFGGDHADVPLEPTGGNLVADLVVDHRLTCVLDVSEMTKADQRRFLTDFANRLYKRNRDPLHVFCEEADEYCPQFVRGDDAKVVRAFEVLVKRGGFRGIGVTLITQRSASLNNDVLTQVETLIPMRTTGPPDRKAIKAWVEYHESGVEAVAELATLATGQAWVFSPHFLRMQRKIQFRRRRTFDSGATPVVGGRKKQAPIRLADVDLAAIKDAMADTIERAKGNDPKELRAEIVRLRAQVERLETAQPAPELVEVPVPVLDTDTVTDLSEQLRAVVRGSTALREDLERVHEILDAGRQARTDTARHTPAAAPKAPARPKGDPVRDNGEVPTLGKGERTVLATLGQWPDGRTHNELAFLAGYSAKASTLGVILAKLRRLGYVADGQPIRLTDAGLDAAGDTQPLPRGPELLDHWRRHPRMGQGERKVLDVLIEAYPAALTNEELCDRAGYSPSASTMGVILSKLRKVGLVEKGARRAAPEFMDSIAP